MASKRIIKGKLWIFGTFIIIALLGYLQTLGVKTGHSGDMVCGGDIACEGYFWIDVPVSTTNYLGETINITNLCFGKNIKVNLTNPELVQNLRVYKADKRYREDNPRRWKPFNFSGSCLPVGNNSFMINATKDIYSTVKWGVENTNIDPIWQGIDRVECTPSSIDFNKGDGTHELTLFSGIRFVEDNGRECVEIEKAKSFKKAIEKGYIWIEYLSKDENFTFDVLDVNYTSITFENVTVSDEHLNKDVPFKIIDKNNESKIKEGKQINIKNKGEKGTITFYSNTSIFDEIYEFGFNSTTVVIRANATGVKSYQYGSSSDIPNADNTYGTELTSAEYLQVGASDNSLAYASTVGSVRAFRFNFTLPLEVVSINWINFSWEGSVGTGTPNFGISIWNYTLLNWKVEKMLRLSTVDQVNFTNVTSGFNSYVSNNNVHFSINGTTGTGTAFYTDYAYIQVSYEETTPPITTIISPLNQSYGNYTNGAIINFNVSLDEIGSACLLELDKSTNITMTKDSNNLNFNITNFTALGSHNARFYCNDTSNNMNLSGMNNVTFNVLQVQDTFMTITANRTDLGAYVSQGRYAEIVAVGEFNYTTGNLTAGTEIEAINYTNIGAVDSLKIILTGTATSDTYIRVNFTTPQNYGVNWVNVSCRVSNIFSADAFSMVIVNKTKYTSQIPRVDIVSTVGAIAESLWGNLYINMTQAANITYYLKGINATQQEIDFWCASDGGASDNFEIDFVQMQIGYKQAVVSADTTPPIVTILSPTNTSYNTQIIPFNVSLNEDGSWCGFFMNLNTALNNITMNKDSNNRNFNYTNFSTPIGSNNVTFICNDTSNNYNTSRWNNVTFNIDTTFPSYSNIIPTNGSYVNDQMGFYAGYSNGLPTYFNLTDAGGISNNSIEVCYGVSKVSPCTNISTVLTKKNVPNGIQVSFTLGAQSAGARIYYNVSANDNAGNRINFHFNYSIDRYLNAPAVTLVSPVDNTNNVSLVWNFTANATDSGTTPPNNANVSNATFMVWNSSGWRIYQKSMMIDVYAVANNSNTTTMNYTFANGTYYWNYQFCDNATGGGDFTELYLPNCNYSSSNYTIAIGVADTCTCPGLNQNWMIKYSDYCRITTPCNLGTGSLYTYNGPGEVYFLADVYASNFYQNQGGTVMYENRVQVI